jgi:hypothetical protein
MVIKKKSEGIKALTPLPEPLSIQDMTMLDWYAMAATIGTVYDDDNPTETAARIFDLADALMAERERRL